jgi:fucose 4-O-acetylase-like acetyltransferase
MERIKIIDSLKGYAIILVLFGHVIVFSDPTGYALSWLFTFIYSFHMPLFLFLSGYLVYQKPIDPKWNFVYKKFRGLIVPYFIWLFIGILVVNNFILDAKISDYLIQHTVTYDNIWFLPALFFSFLLLLAYISIERFLKIKRIDAWLLIPIFSGAYICSWFIDLPVQGLLVIRWFSPFVLLGYLAAEFSGKLLEKQYFMTLSSTLFVLLLPSWDKRVITLGNIGAVKLIIAFILASTGIVFAYSLIKSLQETFVNRFLTICGYLSLEIYLVSNFLALLLIQIFHLRFWLGDGLIAYITGTIIFLFIALTVSLILSYNRTISTILFGRWSLKNMIPLRTRLG